MQCSGEARHSSYQLKLAQHGIMVAAIIGVIFIQMILCFNANDAQVPTLNIPAGFQIGQVVEIQILLEPGISSVIALRDGGDRPPAYIKFNMYRNSKENKMFVYVRRPSSIKTIRYSGFRSINNNVVFVRLWYKDNGINVYFNGVRYINIVTEEQINEIAIARGDTTRAKLRLHSENKYLCLSDDVAQCGTIFPELPDYPENVCKTARIVGGKIAKPGRFPYQAALRRNTSSPDTAHFCGGVLIDQCWVMTAAHCIRFSSEKKFIYVRVGDYYNGAGDIGDYESSQDIGIEEIFKHSSFRKTAGFRNDIALIKLFHPCATLGKYVQPACLPTSTTQFTDGTQCRISGWGANEFNQAQEDYSKCLMKAWVPLELKRSCELAYPTNAILDSMVCAGMVGVDTCQGDSGGPLACRDDSKWYIWGLTSYGENCGKTYGVYTKVFEFRDWYRLQMFNYCAMTSRKSWEL